MQLIENASKKEVLMMSFEEKMKKELKMQNCLIKNL